MTSAVTWHAQIRCIQYVASGSMLDGQTRHTTNKPLHLSGVDGTRYVIVQVSIILSVFKKYSVHIFFQTQTKLAVVVTEKPLLGSVNKVLLLPLPLSLPLP